MAEGSGWGRGGGGAFDAGGVRKRARDENAGVGEEAHSDSKEEAKEEKGRAGDERLTV